MRDSNFLAWNHALLSIIKTTLWRLLPMMLSTTSASSFHRRSTRTCPFSSWSSAALSPLCSRTERSFAKRSRLWCLRLANPRNFNLYPASHPPFCFLSSLSSLVSRLSLSLSFFLSFFLPFFLSYLHAIVRWITRAVYSIYHFWSVIISFHNLFSFHSCTVQVQVQYYILIRSYMFNNYGRFRYGVIQYSTFIITSLFLFTHNLFITSYILYKVIGIYLF